MIIRYLEKGRKEAGLGSRRSGAIVSLRSSAGPWGFDLGDPFIGVPSWGNVTRPSWPHAEQSSDELCPRSRS